MDECLEVALGNNKQKTSNPFRLALLKNFLFNLEILGYNKNI